MSDKTNSTLPDELDAAKTGQVDESRRRLAKVGIAGSGVILTLASRSVLGGWGVCTGSEIMSGNLSKPGDANPCGCSPGYWGNQNGYATWMAQLGNLISSSHAPTALFNTVFGVTFFGPNTGSALTTYGPNVTLWQAVHDKQSTTPIITCKGNNQNAAFHAVAALMNASVYGSRYPVPAGYQTPAGVINMFSAAASNCTLEDFVTIVDIYGKVSDMWCFGDRE
ncbi:MAG: hypothetical protein Q8O79_04325 [Pseudomonadota bacterium]|nr:hypothetical protein [Pseudomonadota bacterium]